VKANTHLKLNTAHLKPGMRVAVGVSGGADSVALLRALACRASELGLVLSVAHLHHGLRGAEADADLEFVRELAGRLRLPFVSARVDTAAEAARLEGKPAETIEEAARRVRYGWFRGLMGDSRQDFPQGLKPGFHPERPNGTTEVVPLQNRTPNDTVEVVPLRVIDAVATAHTLDDQAETVLAKFLRGAWTEGLSGIHPVVEFAEGRVVRPLLETTRGEVEAYLKALGQDWREDSTNRQTSFTRNRIRHELLPLLEGWNPRLKEHLAQMAELARDEEAWWKAEVRRAAEDVVLRGKPVRGGGRAASEGIALDVARLRELPPAMQRRVIRRAAGEMGIAPDFCGTEALRELALEGRAGERRELAGGLQAERTHRELRMTVAPEREDGVPEEFRIPVPGEGEGFGVSVRIEVSSHQPSAISPQPAVLRNWKPGDRVQLRHSAAPKRVKEVLERMKVSGTERAHWPVLEHGGRILWMRGVALEPEPGLMVTVTEIKGTGAAESA
jgi:tRNA(Ile)-lysidine synthase